MEINFGNNIKYLRIKNNLTQTELANKLGFNSHTTIAKWESGEREPEMRIVLKVAELFNITLNELIDRPLTSDNIDLVDLNTNTLKIPVLGHIPAGIPIEAIEDVLDYIEIPKDWKNGNKEWFGLMVKGDSMEPDYKSGDTIIVLQQNDCDSGQDCVVLVNGDDATFKRVIKQEDSIILKPLNNSYDPILYNSKDIYELPVEILGVVKEVRRKVN